MTLKEAVLTCELLAERSEGGVSVRISEEEKDALSVVVELGNGVLELQDRMAEVLTEDEEA